MNQKFQASVAIVSALLVSVATASATPVAPLPDVAPSIIEARGARGGFHGGFHGGGHRPGGWHGGHRPGGAWHAGGYHRPGGWHGHYHGGYYGGWRRPYYGWRPGGAIAAGAAIGFLGAAAAAAYASSAAPAAGLCWYYTDASRSAGFWDNCP